MIRYIREQYPEYADLTDEQFGAAIHRKYYPDMPRAEFNIRTTRPNYDDLQSSAVTGGHSLDIQEADPTVKPAVKMTFQQFLAEMPKRPKKGKISIILEDGTVYVIDSTAIDPAEALEKILEGDDSEILGYPQKGEHDCCVTRQGDIVTDPMEMRKHAMTGNMMWACCGNQPELNDKAQKVSAAIKKRLLEQACSCMGETEKASPGQNMEADNETETED